MSNNTFTLENTADATHLKLDAGILTFKNASNKTFLYTPTYEWLT